MKVFEQNLSPRRLQAQQLELLNRQIAYAAANCSFYAGLRGVKLARLEDIAELPFTTAQNIVSQGADLICVPAAQVRRIVSLHTSGTDGPWKRLYFTADDLEQTVAFFAVGMRYLCQPGSRVLICMPGIAEDGVGQLLARGLERLGAEPVLFGPIGDYAAAAACLRQVRPHTVVGIPAQVRRLALTAPDCPPVNLLLSADRVSPVLRQTLERLWGCQVFEHYGLTESGLGGAVECPAHSGLHIRHDALYVEIVEPGGNRVLPAGQWGEIVFSTLNRQAMPLLRYRTGDLGRLLTGPCGCGCQLPRLDRVAGRLSELAQPLSVYELDDLLLADDGVEDFQAVWQNGTLRVTAAGDLETVRRRLNDRYPQLRLEVRSGAGFITRGTLKRRVEREP